MEIMLGIAMGVAAETLALLGVIFISAGRERVEWKAHETDRFRFRCVDMVCPKRKPFEDQRNEQPTAPITGLEPRVWHWG